MPEVKPEETQKDYVDRCIPIVLEEGSAKDAEQASAICHSKYSESHSIKEYICPISLQYKEDIGKYEVFIATTHPDRAVSKGPNGEIYKGDILSVNVMHQIKDLVNNVAQIGSLQGGAYRSVSLHHDWIKQNNPELDEVAFLEPNAEVVKLEDGHYGVKTTMVLNDYYRGEIPVDEIKFRIKTGHYGGLSIEYNNDEAYTKPVKLKDKLYRFIDKLSAFAGTGLARARKIANPNASFVYKEVELEMSAEEQKPQETQPVEPTPVEPTPVEDKKEDKVLESKEQKPTMNFAELLQSKEFKEAVEAEINIKKEVLKTKETPQRMEENVITLAFKEMNEAIKENKLDSFKYKEASSRYFEANDESIRKMMTTTGIPLNSTMQVKCDGTKLRIVDQFQIKDTLDTTSNASTYTQSQAEFADVYLPGIIDTFNNQTNLFGALRKVNHLEGGDHYGWRIKTVQRSGLSVDPDTTSVNKDYMRKLKLRTPIKEYRAGISVNDFVLHHSRASMGDLFRVEVESVMKDLMLDINTDLFTEQADGDGNKILGLEAVADSAGNTTLYGLTRSTANRLAPDSATDTYTAVGGALTTAYLRLASEKVEVEGAMHSNLRYVCNPRQRTKLFELMDDNQRFAGQNAQFGFMPDGTITYDTIPFIIDFKCQTDAIFCVDLESYYIVVSRAPQLIGLAKLGAAEEAYVSTYIAAVYEQPRRIYMLDTLTT